MERKRFSKGKEEEIFQGRGEIFHGKEEIFPRERERFSRGKKEIFQGKEEIFQGCSGITFSGTLMDLIFNLLLAAQQMELKASGVPGTPSPFPKKKPKPNKPGWE